MSKWLETLVGAAVLIVAICFGIGYINTAWLLFRHFGYTGSPFAWLTYEELVLNGAASLYFDSGVYLGGTAVALMVRSRVGERPQYWTFLVLAPAATLFLVSLWAVDAYVTRVLLIWLSDRHPLFRAVPIGIGVFLSLFVLRGAAMQRFSAGIRKALVAVFWAATFYPVAAMSADFRDLYATQVELRFEDGTERRALWWLGQKDGLVYCADINTREIVGLRADRIIEARLLNVDLELSRRRFLGLPVGSGRQ